MRITTLILGGICIWLTLACLSPADAQAKSYAPDLPSRARLNMALTAKQLLAAAPSIEKLLPIINRMSAGDWSEVVKSERQVLREELQKQSMPLYLHKDHSPEKLLFLLTGHYLTIVSRHRKVLRHFQEVSIISRMMNDQAIIDINESIFDLMRLEAQMKAFMEAVEARDLGRLRLYSNRLKKVR